MKFLTNGMLDVAEYTTHYLLNNYRDVDSTIGHYKMFKHVHFFRDNYRANDSL